MTNLSFSVLLFFASLPADHTLSYHEKRVMLHATGWHGVSVGQAIDIINCESYHGLVGAIGDGGLANGVFQIHTDFWGEWAEREHGFILDDPLNPLQNARLARLIYERDMEVYKGDGWRQWSCAKAISR